MPYLCSASAPAACTIISTSSSALEFYLQDIQLMQIKKACADSAQAFRGFVAL
jgi:hypothetical protein